MMRNLLLFLVLCLLVSMDVNGQGWLWAKGSLCSNGYGSEMDAIAYDKFGGSLYIGGCNLGDSLCLPPFTIHNTYDSEQLFIVKYDTSGNVLWYRTNTAGRGWVQNLTTDALGNLYVLGCYVTPSISLGSVTLYNQNYYYDTLKVWNACYFVAKYDTYGNLKWLNNGVNENFVYSGTVHVGNIATDAVGNSYVCASFADSTIHLGSYTFHNVNYTASVDSPGDILLAKYDSSGNLIWAKTFGGTGDEKSLGIAVGTNNTVYVTGWYKSPTLIFGGTTLTHNGNLNTDAFLAAFDTSGNALWAKTSYGNAWSNAVSLDNDNNVFMGGEIFDTLFVTFGADTLRNVNLSGGSFLTKYDTAGNCIWTKGFYPIDLTTGGWVNNMLFGITTDGCNNVWAAGFMNHSTAGIIIDSGLILHCPAGSYQDPMFFVGYNSSGSLLQSLSLASGGDDGPGLTSDLNGNIYFGGDTWATMVLGGDTIHHYSGNENMFIAKYDPNVCPHVVSVPLQNISSKDAIVYPNPANNECTIFYDGDLPQGAQLMIYDMAGRLMINYQLANKITTVPIVAFSPGIYQCRIIAEGRDVVTKKLVVMR